ncbi:MAG TPA: SLC13 family permease [Acidimicrobiia bacterium]|nr:SLC13 family permease [Acidimicrobiia bacterium]
MTGDAWITLAVVAATLVLLVSERLPAAATVFGASTVLLVTDVIDAGQAFSGFSNPAPITVGALYVIAGGVEATGALEWLTRRTMPVGRPKGGVRRDLARFLPVPLASSSLLNNTTIVAMLGPRVRGWARNTGRSASSFLMPLSFAAILGGLVTTIGTSTNLVVSGLLEAAGQDGLGLFEISRVGVPVAVVGAIVLALFVPMLLPERRDARPATGEGAREYTVEMIVDRKSAVAGLGVGEAGLRNLEGVYLVEIERHGHRIAPVSPSEVLVEGDRLTFAGNVDRVLDLQRFPGLIPAESRHFRVMADGETRIFYEMVVAPGSQLVGHTLKESDFRNRYGAAVVAIHRAGERVQEKLGAVRLHPGDVLLALSDQKLKRRIGDHGDFLVVSRLDGDTPPRREKARTVELLILALLVVVGFGWLDIVEAALLAAFAMVALRVLSAHDAQNAVDLQVLVLIAASFGLGEAMATSGLAETVAGGLVDAFSGLGDIGLLAGILIGTVVVTEMITNNAAAVLMFPIAMAVAAEAGLDPRPFAMAIAVGASASFLTPIGYQTNTMVYGMGGYRFGDFVRVGFPLTIAVIVVALAVIPVAYPF